MFNATFNNIAVISWWSVLLVRRKPEKTTDLTYITDKLYHIILYWMHFFAWAEFELSKLVVIDTDYTGSSSTIGSGPLRPYFCMNLMLFFPFLVYWHLI